MAISIAREDFLSDVITTAIEGGIGYWSQCSQYQWVDSTVGDGKLRVSVGQRRPDEGTRATIEDIEDDQREYHITPSVIHNGIGEIEREIHLARDDLREMILAASRENDAGMIDADCADVIVQAGLFGEVRYG
jgi:hypothetical protein